MAAAQAAERRLYATGFEGWDISLACILTDYLVALTALAAALFWYIRQDVAYSSSSSSSSSVSCPSSASKLKRPPVPSVFVIFCLCEVVAFMSGGLMHQAIRGYYLAGEDMSLVWFEGTWEWMIGWTLAVTFASLGATLVLGAVISANDMHRYMLILWYVVGSIVTASEVLISVLHQISRAGMASAVWALISAFLTLVVVCWKGHRAPAFAFITSGLVLRFVGFAIVIMTPSSCKDYSKNSCPFPKDFNGNAAFHSVIALSILPLFAGATLRLRHIAASVPSDVPVPKP